VAVNTSWELTMYLSRFLTGRGLSTQPDASKLWTEKNDDGTSDFTKIVAMSKDGWELVSVTPITGQSGETRHILFTFKRALPG
jgi:hypothetical protein